MVITLIRILLFGKLVILTPEPITIDGNCVEMILAEPLEAITSGANLQMDISAILEEAEKKTYRRIRADIRDAIPKGSISAELFGKNEESVKLYFEGGASIRSDEVWITLDNRDGMPTNQQFQRLKVCADITLKNVRLAWWTSPGLVDTP